MYYILVTVGTVGYGEPHGVWGNPPAGVQLYLISLWLHLLLCRMHLIPAAATCLTSCAKGRCMLQYPLKAQK